MHAPTVVTMSPSPARVPDDDGGWSAFIEAALANLGWSNGVLADAVGVHQTLIGRWIKGTAHPSVESVRKVCEVLNCDIRDGLIAAGLLTRRELRMVKVGTTRPELEMFDDEELFFELHRRAKARKGRAGLELVSSATTYEQDAGPETHIEEAGADGNHQPQHPVTRSAGRDLPPAGG